MVSLGTSIKTEDTTCCNIRTQRLGVIKIQHEFLRHDPELVKHLFVWLDGIVIEAVSHYTDCTIEYVVLSPKFKEVPYGGVITKYQVMGTPTGFALEEYE